MPIFQIKNYEGLFLFHCILFFKKEYYCVVQADLKLVIFFTQPPEYRDCRCAPPHTTKFLVGLLLEMLAKFYQFSYCNLMGYATFE